MLEKRTVTVAAKVTEFLESSGPYQKAIIFCEDIDHAERMRQALVNLNPQRVKENRKYVMRITGDEQEGKAELDNFINPEERYPVIATTSKLMTTGVDAQTCKLIVLDQRIQSMTEFKQIIGRGTRINDDYNKHWFTILDFKKATELFADPDFDGDPVKVYQPKAGDPVNPDSDEIDEGSQTDEHACADEAEGYEVEPGETWHDDDSNPPGWGGDDEGKSRRIKYVVGDVEVSVIAERVQYLGPDGKLITESLKDFTRKQVKEQYASLSDFLHRWHGAERKQVIIDELTEQCVIWDDLIKDVSKKLGAEPDPFDVICHIVYDQPPLTRKERAEQVRKNNYFSQYEGASRQVLDALLEKYTDAGIESIEDVKILTLAPFSQIGAPMELINAFGGKPGYTDAVKNLEDELYRKTS